MVMEKGSKKILFFLCFCCCCFCFKKAKSSKFYFCGSLEKIVPSKAFWAELFSPSYVLMKFCSTYSDDKCDCFRYVDGTFQLQSNDNQVHCQISKSNV